MQYVQPVGGLANDPYVDANPGAGQEGSPVPAAAIEHPQRELVALITDAGLAPSGASLTQVAAAIKMIFQKASAVSAAASGTVDAITANFTPAIAALSDHLLLIVRAGGANTSTTPTFTPASATIAAKTIVKGHNQPLVAGDISGAGFRAELQYDAALDKWVLLNPATGVSITTVPDATTAVKGKVQLATPVETQTGTDATKAVTSDGLAKTMLGGVGQAMVDVTASRALGTTYTNSTGRTIVVYYSGNVSGGGATADAVINGVTVPINAFSASGAAGRLGATLIVPNGATYSVTNVGTMNSWREFR